MEYQVFYLRSQNKWWINRHSGSESMLLVTKLLHYPASVTGIKFVKLKDSHFLVAETI